MRQRQREKGLIQKKKGRKRGEWEIGESVGEREGDKERGRESEISERRREVE